ncbi:hypothetical protein GCM10010174_79490 [Kutzneria viridogrisea]|uniref:Uncharacterized protein n=2 Tax=Kutzneria TaxID=43356 RepID=W5WIY0_9PSEU|nr:hypothetical protein [Kutzneria albida]AHH98114.1 hypothetical protein KALB_4752 [Kutzneria albida DSM 43870]MBA8924203.1 hypothetical protein [Kutzneria viridogrisea]
MHTAEALAHRVTRLIWTVLTRCGRTELADLVVDHAAGLRGTDLRARAVLALRHVLADQADQQAVDAAIRHALTRDEIDLLPGPDRHLVELFTSAGTSGAAGWTRQRARQVVTALIARVAQAAGPRPPEGRAHRRNSSGTTPSQLRTHHSGAVSRAR